MMKMESSLYLQWDQWLLVLGLPSAPSKAERAADLCTI